MVRGRVRPLTLFQFLYEMVKPFYWQLASLTCVALYWAIHVSLQPYVIKTILDQAAVDPSFYAMLNPILLYIVVSLISTFNTQLYDFAGLHFYPQLKARIIAHATDVVTHQPYTFFQTEMAGSLVNRIKDLAKGTADIIQIFLDQFFCHSLGLFFACASLMFVHPLLSLILCIWAILFIIISFVSTRQARAMSHQLSAAQSNIIGFIADCFSNILTINLFATQKHEQENLQSHLNKAIHIDIRLRWFLLKIITMQGVITALMISSCVIVLVGAVDSHHITVGDFGLVLTLTLSISDAIWNLAQEISKFSEGYGLVTQGILLINTPPTIVDIPHASSLVVTKGEIRFEKVHFHYHASEPFLTDHSLIIHPGQKVGIVGASGSGKSTFVKLILRLFDIQSGHIFIDGQDIAHVTQDSLHRSITMIPQDASLFHRTVKENIKYGRLEASDQEVIQAAQQAHAHEFIMRLPDQYDSIVGERGGKLSGGQQQRISIARAFLKNSPLLILDESTSALDTVTERFIQDSLMNLMRDKTTLIIAHRLTTLTQLDRILVFHLGKVVEDGTHKELIARKGFYTKLWHAQVEGVIKEEILSSLL